MSAASGLAAAKRRRSKNEGNTKPKDIVKDNIKGSTDVPPKPSLTVSESIMYLNNRLSNLERGFQLNNNQTTSDLENKLKMIESNLEQLKLLMDGKESKEVENAGELLTVSMFNSVIQEVASDMSELNDKLTKQNEYISHVQNMNITLNNTVSNLLLEKYNTSQFEDKLESNEKNIDEQSNIKLSINDISDSLNLFDRVIQNDDDPILDTAVVEEAGSIENVEDNNR